MISFIIPTKNEEKVIEESLKRLSQYTGDKEIIISDGNSTDNTLSIARKYTQNIVENTSGIKQTIAEGRNEGGNVAKGDFLVFMDTDVTIPVPDLFFKNAISVFEKNINLGALTAFITVEPKSATMMDRFIFKLMNINNLISNNFFGIGASMGEFQMIRRDVFNAVGGYNKELAAGEDYEMFRRISKSYKTTVVKELTVYHSGRRVHQVGWLKLLPLWFMNYISTLLFKKSVSKEWKEIR